jgi:hypothetical protein
MLSCCALHAPCGNPPDVWTQLRQRLQGEQPVLAPRPERKNKGRFDPYASDDEEGGPEGCRQQQILSPLLSGVTCLPTASFT